MMLDLLVAQYPSIEKPKLFVSVCCDLQVIIVTVIILSAYQFQGMCDHKKRPKLFCVFQNCPQIECFGCSPCLKSIHKKCQSECFVDENEMASLLGKFHSSSQSRQSQKMCNLKIYKLLTRIKTELSNKIQQAISDLMSKIKYPFLFRSEILDIYRQVRDKNYLKLQPDKLRRFYQLAKQLKNEEFAQNDDIYYNEYLVQTHKQLQALTDKLHALENGFHFTLAQDINDMQLACLKEIQSYLKTHKNQKKHIRNDSSQKLGIFFKPNYQSQTNKSQFLTPTKQNYHLNVSLDSMTIKSSSIEKERKKSDMQIENQSRSLFLKSPLSSHNEFQVKRKASDDQMFFETPNIKVSINGNKSQLNGNQMEKNQKNIFVYNDQLTNSMQIKISDISRQTNRTDHTNKLEESIEFLNKSAEIQKKSFVSQVKKRNFREEIQEVINQRQEKIRKRLQDLKREKQYQTNSKVQQIQQHHKQTKQLKVSIVMDLEAKTDRKISQKNTRSPKKSNLQSPRKAQARENTRINANSQRKSSKKIDNVSLNKYVGKGGQKIKQPTNNLPNMKQIPLVSSSIEQTKRTKPLKRKSTVVVEEQLQSACVYYLKVKQLKQKEKIGQFLQHYNQKCANNLTAVQHLTYLYLQQGKAKECLNLSNEYLQRMELLPLNQSNKLSLIINKSASLNMLGRYNETIGYIIGKLQKIDHEKLHKNLADAYFNVNTSDKAIYHYEKAIKLNDKYDQAYYNLAVLLYNQSSFFNAKMNITKAISLEAKNQYYNQLLVAINERIKMNEMH